MHEPDCATVKGKTCDCCNRYEWSDAYQVTLVPTVGMAATYCIGSDSYAMTVVAVERNGQVIVLGSDEDRGSVYIPATLETRRPDQLKRATKRQDGRYRLKGKDFGNIVLGIRETHLCREF